MAPQSMRSNGIYADYEKMAAEGGHRSQGAAPYHSDVEKCFKKVLERKMDCFSGGIIKLYHVKQRVYWIWRK